MVKQKMRWGGALVATCCAFAAGGLQAHGVWVAQRAGEWAVVLGEAGTDDAYKVEAVKRVAAHGASGAPLAVSLSHRERTVVVEPDPASTSLAVSFEDGFWSQTADGKWHSGSRLAVPQARKSGYYQMFNRTVIARGSVPRHALGLPLEIVPQADPLSKKRGDRLRVQVLFNGLPLANSRVWPDYLNGEPRDAVRTDQKGFADIRLRSAGLNVVKVSHAVARADKDEADEDSYASTLAFSLAHEE